MTDISNRHQESRSSGDNHDWRRASFVPAQGTSDAGLQHPHSPSAQETFRTMSEARGCFRIIYGSKDSAPLAPDKQREAAQEMEVAYTRFLLYAGQCEGKRSLHDAARAFSFAAYCAKTGEKYVLEINRGGSLLSGEQLDVYKAKIDWFDKAADAFTQAVRCSQLLPNSTEKPAELIFQAHQFSYLGDLLRERDKRLEVFIRCVVDRLNEGRFAEAGVAIGNVDAVLVRNYPESAKDLTEQALGASQKDNPFAKTLFQRGAREIYRANAGEIVEYYQKALESLRKLGPKFEKERNFNFWCRQSFECGLATIRLADLSGSDIALCDKGIGHLEEAARGHLRAGDRYLYAKALGTVARTYKKLRRFRKARDAYDKAIKESPDIEQRSKLLGFAGCMELDQKRNRNAYDYFGKLHRQLRSQIEKEDNGRYRLNLQKDLCYTLIRLTLSAKGAHFDTKDGPDSQLWFQRYRTAQSLASAEMENFQEVGAGHEAIQELERFSRKAGGS